MDEGFAENGVYELVGYQNAFSLFIQVLKVNIGPKLMQNNQGNKTLRDPNMKRHIVLNPFKYLSLFVDKVDGFENLL